MRTILLLLAAFWIAMVFVAKWHLGRMREELSEVVGVGEGCGGCCHYGGRCVTRRGRVIMAPGATEISLGLRWLARHQEQDGRWSGAHFDDHCSKIRCKGAGSFEDDLTLTSLALLDFMGFGVVPRDTRAYTDPFDGRRRCFGQSVAWGLGWLLSQQAEDGAIGPRDQLVVARHTLAAFALVEAECATHTREYRAAAERAVHFLEACRAKDGGFGFAPGDSASDSLVSWRALLVLRVARDLGLEVAPESLSFEHLCPAGRLSWSALDDEAPIASYQETALRGCAEGSWEGPRGRVDATVRKVLALELYYRYQEPTRLRF
jgi:hypothetical protein